MAFIYADPTGATGPQGPSGPSGGPTGPTGPVGATGPQGRLGRRVLPVHRGPTGPCGCHGTCGCHRTRLGQVAHRAMTELGQQVPPVPSVRLVLPAQQAQREHVGAVGCDRAPLEATGRSATGPTGRDRSSGSRLGRPGQQDPLVAQRAQWATWAQLGATGPTGPTVNRAAGHRCWWPTGATGPAGATGPTGASPVHTGLQGEVATRVTPGPTGATGPTGPRGPAGQKGATGATGPSGFASCTLG